MVDSLQCNRNTTVTQGFDSHRRKRTGLADRPKRPWHTDGSRLQRIVDGFRDSGQARGFHFCDAGWHYQRLGAGREQQPSDHRGGQLVQESNVHGLGHHQQRPGSNFLYAADNANNHVDMFDRHLYAGEVVWRSVDPIELLGIWHPGHQWPGLRHVCGDERERRRVRRRLQGGWHPGGDADRRTGRSISPGALPSLPAILGR